MAIGGSSSSRKLLARKRLQKRSSARRILMETLESRQLMAVGPQLLGIQPNSGDLLDNGEVLNISPREFTLRFDDAAGIDASTLGGIRIIRSGDDGVFERASMATDFSTNGQTLVEFYSQILGEAGNGIEVRFTKVNRADSRLPVITNNGLIVSIQLNSNPALETRVEDLLQVLNPATPSSATSLVYAVRLRGSQTVAIGQSTDVTRPLVLGGANSAKVTTSFGQSSTLQVRLTAVESGNSGLGVSVAVTGRDRGGAGLPIISVDGKRISVEINTNSRYATTVQEFVDALNNNSQTSGLVRATLVSGSGSTRLGSLPINYSPLVLSGVLDVEVIPGYIGLGDNGRDVIVRFAETLPDDKYRIEILGQGVRTLRNTKGEAFNSGVSRSIAFELDLGAQIESIVPQPVTRNSSGQLVHNRNQIEIYFNNDDLINSADIVSVNGISLTNLKALRSPLYFQNGDTIVFASGAFGSTSVISPSFYQLFHTAGTLNSTDDTRILPNSIRYYPDADRAVLGFERNLDELVNSANVVLPLGELRLRVGTNESVFLPPVVLSPAADAADTFANATNLNVSWAPGGSGSQSVLINAGIVNTSPYVLDFPGGSNEPGNRQIRMQDNLRLGADSVDGTSTFFYNFQSSLGTSGSLTFANAITEQQKQRVREVFSLYENHLGVRFVESTNLGLTIAVGDTRSVVPFPDLPGSSTPGVTELNGPGFTTFEAGTLLNSNQLAAVLDIQDFSDSTRNAFGGPFMRASMQAIGRLLGLGNADELPSLTIQSDNAVFVPGIGTEIILPGDGDIVHGQYLYRPDSKDIDLYQFSIPAPGRISIEAFAERMSQSSLLDTTLRLYQQNTRGGWEEIAFNDDYYSSDSMIELELQQGNYIVGVSASGNKDYDPTIADSGIGGRSEGQYQLRMDFAPPAQAVLRDSTGVAFDGDADGVPGGTFNFWFRPSGPSNTKFVDKAAPTTGNGTTATPFKYIKDALIAAVPGDVVRIVGNGGADGQLSTPADNLAYEIGFDSTRGMALPDGATFDVPKNVAVIIDAGAILKLRRARIGVGSTSVNVDRSAGTLMVLGTPVLLNAAGAVIKDAAGNNISGDVYMTSVSDTTLGKSANAAVVGSTPTAGDWGGLDFRNRIDASTPSRKNFEATGQFLNWVSHANLRYGGGQVVIDSQSQVVTPIQMFDARPTIAFTTITASADAGISATPNSFLETSFHSPLEQGTASFTVDYERVGPDIHNNRLTGNSLNGLQIRLRTSPGAQLERMTVQGRFDDLDIVHIIPENLEIAGTAGGAVQLAVPVGSITLAGQTGGTLTSGFYNYRLTVLDAGGVESLASEPTSSIAVNSAVGTTAVQLRNLPQGARRIYRSGPNGAAPYTLVAQLPAGVSSFTDSGASLGSILTNTAPAVVGRLDARLAIDAGMIVKLQGSRIDVGMGAQLIAEGSDDLPVVFTSIVDARYGAGGTFDTANRAGSQTAVAGDWGGIYVGHTSKASLDYAVVAYGGGTTRIEGGFADFNAIETHQGELRLANSRLENNAAGAGTSTDPERGGRLSNSEATIFIRGSQPIIVNNEIVGSGGPAMSINVSALNASLVDDYGRSRGRASFYTGRVGNRGALVSGNRLDKNDINGIVVRGGSLTTEGVWDDTDIVHVVESEITIPDYHAFGGLRLTSSPAESLVVKLSGATAGFTANGVPLDNADRIGGSVQLVGNPGYPVVLSSLEDCTVGAGFTPGGAAQNDTHNSGLCGPVAASASFADVVVVLDESGSMFGAQQFTIGMIADLEAALQRSGIGSSAAGGNRFGLVGYGDINAVGRSVPVGANGALFGTAAQYGTAVGTLTTNGFIEDGYDGIDEVLENYAFRSNAQKFIILVTDEPRDIVTPSLTYSTILGDLRAEGVNLQGILGTFIVDQNFNTAIALDANDTAYKADGNGGFTTSPNGQLLFGTGSTIADYADMVFETGGIVGDIFQISRGGNTATSFSNAMVSSIVLQAGGSLAAPGDWRSVLLDTYSNDRNVAIVNELESPIAAAASSNNTTGKAQFLGGLAPNEKAGDENQRLGFQLQGVLAQPSDVDVYSFRANAGTEVWLDIDRTLNSVDTVVELVDADGRTLALSNDSLLEEADPTLLYKAIDLAAQSVNPLRKSSAEFYYESALGSPKDLFSTNPKDAGLRVKLPGEIGLNNLYHIRVRSSNLRPGDAASRLTDPNFVNAGLSQGSYQLQIRLSEVDEVPGSSVSFADIRYAQTGLSFVGVPGNSPLLGENSEVEVVASGATNNTFANAQNLSNLLQTNRQAISVAGNINSFTDVDWFSFDIDYQKISATGLREYFATVIDMDYADGIGRPDTSIYVFNAAGSLILAGLSSNLVDDQASPGTGAGSSDLSRGSAGGQDPYIGSYELPSGRYFIAVTNSLMTPEVLATYTDPNSNAPGIRLQPIEGVQLIAEDHLDFSSGSTAVPPVTPVLFPRAGTFNPVTGTVYTTADDSIVDFGLGDIKLYISQDVGQELTNIYIFNPLTGEFQNQVGRIGFDIQDIAFRDNGQLRAFDRALETQAGNTDRDGLIDYINIDPGTAVATAGGTSGLQTFHVETTAGTPPTQAAVASDDGMNPEAITFAVVGGQERGFMIANRPTPFGSNPFYSPVFNSLPNVGTSRPGPSYFTNVIYEFDENSGAATSAPFVDKTGVPTGLGAGTAIRDRGYIETLPILPSGLVNANLLASTLVAREVTTGNANGTPTRVIRDGDTFTLLDNVNFPARFEFDLGPDLLVTYDPASGRFVQDGMKFTLDGVDYEFDTGSVVLVTAPNGSFLADGSTVRVVNSSGAVQIFEFDNNGTVVGAGNVRVPYSAGSTQADLARALATAVNGQAGFGVNAQVNPNSNRVSFTNTSTVTPIQATGTGLTVTGTLGVTAGAVRIPISESATTREFVDAITQGVGAGITVSYDSGRMSFSGVINGSFTDLELAGIVTDLGSVGGVAGGNVQVRVLASDTAETVAARIAQAINGSLIPGLSATSNGELVSISGGTVQAAGRLGTAGVSPGGIVRGAAVIGNSMYAVSDEGGLYRVGLNGGLTQSALGPAGNVGTYITTSYDLTGIRFTGLVAGPSHASNGQLSQLLFGIDAQGNIHAFDTAGRLQPVFANGKTSISTGVFNANGLAFSTLDFNLWHISGQRSGDAGHGLPSTPNDSRGGTNGGSSLYFGYEGPQANGVPDLNGAAVTGITNSYDFPGGAAGAIESANFDLAGIAAADLPTLYFNYRFETEGAASDLGLGDTATDYMRDALRVYAAGEDGQWILLATNNDPAQAGSNSGSRDDELDERVSGNPTVQRLFDNNGQWRQARVPLDLFAGQRNVRLRVEFSTAGGFGYGFSGGKGPEIRTISAERLVDGETLVINGERFEIEMGSSLSLPGGRSIANGDSVTIEGVRYVFTDGSGSAPVAPDVAVPFSTSNTAEEIALALQTAILGAVVTPTVVTGLNFTSESNDTIARATLSGITGDSVRVIGNGNIGDNPANATPGQDVDMIQFDLEAGGTFSASIDAASIGSGLDSFLRVFDSEGRPLRNANGLLVQNDNRPGSTDSALTFVAPYTGTYYLGVSGAGNQLYNASVQGTASTGSTGNYNLLMNVVRKLNPVVSGNRLQLDGVKAVSVSAGSPFTVSGSLGTSGIAVPITVDMTAGQVALALRQSVATQFAGGVTSVYTIRNSDTIELAGLTVLDAGPFGLTTSFVGDRFSAFNTSTNFDGTRNNSNPGALGAQNNAFEGVYLDDFIIGVAGRGEMVLNGTTNTTFVQDPQLTVTNPDRSSSAILVGPYQFEIRGGEEYGTPLLAGAQPSLVLDTAVASDSRQANGLSIRFNAASAMVSGETFTVGDGSRTLTFEMDDVNDSLSVQAGNIALPFNTGVRNSVTGGISSESAEVIAARFRDILNSAPIQAQLQISANLSNNDRTGASSDTVVLIGTASTNVPTSIGQKIVSTGKGAENRKRPQGQIVVDSARISDSLGFGISIDSAPRDPVTNAPLQGSPRNTVTINTDRLATGAVVMNSELLFNGAGGFSVQGDPSTANVPAAAVPFVRLVNNTIVGGTVSSVTSFLPTIYGNQVFAIGDLAFADAVVDYTPLLGGGPGPLVGLDVPDASLGAPNFSGSGEPLVNEGVVSLGRGGRLVLQFTDNLLTGSGDGNPDLVIFEVGDSEEVLVEVSADGSRFTAVGRASAASPTIDLDAFGFNRNSRLSFVRLTDVSNQGSITGDSVGADIDAVGALSSVAVDNYRPGGTGISVTNNATATLLNNVIINSVTGVTVDASSASTVIGGMTFQRNTANTAGVATVGQFPSLVGNNVSVFVSVGTSNIYPAPSSPVIDSSIDSLQDRPSLVSVKQPLGIAASPILAPQYDSTGQLRVDDPSVETPFGFGENVFKDRGAQDRADFVGPSVYLVQPADNDSLGADTNPEESVVELTGTTLKYFDIQLIDGIEPSDPGRGSNVDDLTVSSGSVLVYRNNVPLVEGVDYSFGYNNTSGIIRLTPLAGIWRSESVYTIRFLNVTGSAIVAKPAANYNDGDSFDVVDASGSRTTFELDLGYIVRVPSADGLVADIVDGTTFTIDDGTRRFTFEFDNNSTSTSTNRVIQIAANASPAAVVTAVQEAIRATSLAVSVTDVGNGVLQIGGSNSVVMLTETSGLTVTGSPGVRPTFGLQIPLQAGLPVGVTDGQTFVIDRSGAPVTFELDTDGTVQIGNVPVRFVTGASATQIGNALVAAIQGSGLGLSPSYLGSGFVRLGGDANTRLTLTATVLTQQGLAGQPAAVSIPLTDLGLAADVSAEEVAAIIKAAIDAQNLSGVTTTQFGDRIVVEGARGLAGVGVGEIVAIRDHAGNVLKANQADGSTTLTVFLGEGLDYGDAPDPKYASLSSNDGPRHTVVNGLSLGVTVTPDADAKLINADSDDGVTFTSLYAAFNTSFSVTVTNTTGTTAYLSYWFDYNSNGIFEASEGLRQFAVAPSASLITLPPFTTRVPASAVSGTTYARFRLSTDRNAVANPTGAAIDGEVEDYAINILPNPYKNPSNKPSVLDAAGNNLDVNADGFVSPIDALQVINYLNNPSKPRQLTLPVTQPVPPYIDVNGDSVVSPLDALLVINFLNATRPGSGSGEGEFSQGEEGEFDSGLSGVALGSGQEMTLAGNWAAGLENLVMGRRAEGEDDEVVEVSATDVALLSTQDDDDFDFGFEATAVNFSVLDDVLAETYVVEIKPTSANQRGTIRQPLLASQFRK